MVEDASAEKERLAQLRKVASQLFESDAYTRFMTVLQTKPELAQQALQLSMRAVQSTGRKLSDEKLVSILRMISSQTRRESRISIKRK